MRTLEIFAAVFLALVVAPARAQGGGGQEEVDLAELVKQIRRNMVAVEREMDRVEAEAAREDAEAARENLQKLIQGLKGRGDQITSDIDEIIKNIKQSGNSQSSSQSSSQSGQQKPSQARDRNQRQGQKNSSQSSSQSRPEGGRDENNTGEDRPGGRNKAGNKKPESRQSRADVNWDSERWGHLPAELRQRLIDRNFKNFTPPYAKELKEYFKRIGGGK